MIFVTKVCSSLSKTGDKISRCEHELLSPRLPPNWGEVSNNSIKLFYHFKVAFCLLVVTWWLLTCDYFSEFWQSWFWQLLLICFCCGDRKLELLTPSFSRSHSCINRIYLHLEIFSKATQGRKRNHPNVHSKSLFLRCSTIWESVWHSVIGVNSSFSEGHWISLHFYITWYFQILNRDRIHKNKSFVNCDKHHFPLVIFVIGEYIALNITYFPKKNIFINRITDYFKIF